MTVLTTARRVAYLGDGATLAFTVPFKFITNADIEVYVDDVLQSTGVTITGALADTGTATFAAAPAASAAVVIVSAQINDQQTDIAANGPFPAQTVETMADKAMIGIQQLQDGVDRSLKLGITEAGTSALTTLPADRAGMFLVFDADKNPVASAGTGADSALRTDLAASGGSALSGFLASGSGANARSVQSKLRDQVHAFDFIPVAQHAAILAGTSTYDAGPDVQKAIDSLPFGGVVWMPQGLLNSATAWVAHSGVLLKAQRHDISSNTNGSASATYPRVKWTGSAAATMFSVKPAVVGDAVWGGGSDGIAWDGNELAATAVHLDNTKYALFDGSVRNVTFGAVVVDSASGSAGNFSMQNHIRRLEFVWGASVACQDAHGLILGGNGSTAPATQQIVDYLGGLVYNGVLAYVAETDNAHFGAVLGALQAPGTGGAMRIVNAGAQPSNFTQVRYCAGKVFLDNGLKGTWFGTYVSEGGGFTQLAGTSVWDGELTDYSDGKRYKSHTYALRKKIDIAAGAFMGDGATATGKLALQWQTITLANGGTSRATAILPPLYDIDGGVIEGVEVWLGTNGTSGGNLRLQASVTTATVAVSVATPEANALLTAAAPVQNTISKYTLPLSPELAVANGDSLLLAIDRFGADGADTNTDDSYLVGARILYRGTGPSSAGSGTYAIPSW